MIKVVYRNFFMDAVGLHKTFYNIALQPPSWLSYYPFMQNACLSHSSYTVRDGDLKLWSMSLANFKYLSINQC